MREFLTKMIGKQLDIYCGGASGLRGKVLKVEGGVLHLRDDAKQTCYVAIDHIIAVWEMREDQQTRPGFVSQNTK